MDDFANMLLAKHEKVSRVINVDSPKQVELKPDSPQFQQVKIFTKQAVEEDDEQPT